MTNKPENIVTFPDLEMIEEEAGTWIARMDRSPLSPAERAELSAWVRQGPVYREALERMAAVWGGCDALDDLNMIDPVIEENAAPWAFSRRTAVSLSIAATVLLMLCVGVVLRGGVWFGQSQSESYQTAIGEHKSFELVDGSVITLNTNSDVRVDITSKERTIKLMRGEAHFSVAKDKSRPFLVYAGDGVVRAVGTAFSVYLRKNDVEVTVAEGVVELLAVKSPSGNAPVRGETAPALTALAALTANENAVIAQNNVSHVEKISEKAVERKLLWRDGLVGFAGEPLSEVVAEVSRYTEISIEVEDPALNDIPIGGYFAVGDVAGLFEALESVFGLEIEWVDESRVVLARAA